MVKRARPSSSRPSSPPPPPAPAVRSTPSSRRSSVAVATVVPTPTLLPPIEQDNDSLTSLSSNNSTASPPPTRPPPSRDTSAQSHVILPPVQPQPATSALILPPETQSEEIVISTLDDIAIVIPPPRATVGGKGKAGEQALNNAVAAREEVERRRVEYGTTSSASNSLAIGDAIAAEKAAVKANGTVGQSSGGTNGTIEKSNGEGMVLDENQEGEVIIPATLEAATEEEDDAVLHKKRKERPVLLEERSNIIRFTTVTNDNTPASLILLTGLKNIFQKQLPKMPREYIARLVYDRNHYSMAIVKRGLEVVGGITYRPFEGRGFAEIVFCAITGTEQVKGYGSHLMNHLKDYVKATTPRCQHFLTYADNYAIGYFKKQGFTKEITLDRSVWAGYIKDYEGGTIMHCAMLDRIKYLDVTNILAAQKERILTEIRQVSQSHIVHPGLDFFKNRPAGSTASIDPLSVPGLKESGWTPEMDALTRRPKRGPQFSIMQRLLTVMGDHPSAWAFDHPVNADEVTDYYEVIKQPMDLATMGRKLEANTYTTLDAFLTDARLIFSNCRSYNDVGSNYVKFANKLEAFMDEQVKIYLE